MILRGLCQVLTRRLAYSPAWRPSILSRSVQTSSRSLSTAPLRAPRRPAPSPSYILASLRYSSHFPKPRSRRLYTRWDPEEISRAKPLISTQQIAHAAKHPRTHLIIFFTASGTLIYYVYHLEEVPVSGRRRFNCYSDQAVEAQGEMMYHKVMREARGHILPEWDRRVKMVRRVMDRLIPASGMGESGWEVHVIDSNEMNAFVIPGGKVFVFSGIIPIAGDDDGLAAILGHEISHNLAKHAAEQMSTMVLLAPLRWAFIWLDYSGFTMGLGQILGDVALQFGLNLPASRKQESEADYLGLMMMAKACYDPKAAVKVWQRMEAASRSDVPQWLSTHPSNNTRIEQMQKWLPKAEAARAESGCAVTTGFAREFWGALPGAGFGRMT